MSKTLVAAAVLHRNARNFGGHNPRQLVENRIAGPNAGLEQGRLRDKTTAALPHDFSNTFGQSYGVMGLARTAGGVPDEVVGYLLRQRCSEGFFRIFPVAGQTCDEGDADQSAPDVDATALAVQALITARDHGTTIPAGVIAGSVAWLRSVQKANGSFGGGASTPASNTNSTGLAAQALEAAGRHAPAVDAAGFVRRMQITAARAGNGPARIDLGAIALNRAGLNAALQDGLTSTTRGQFRRATPQAYFALNRSPPRGAVGTVTHRQYRQDRWRATGVLAAVLALAFAPLLGGPSSSGAAPAYAAPTASAAAAAAGTPGYCPDGKGVTVVVDFTDLGGDVVVRCAPGPVEPGYSGLDALQGAGFSVAGTQRWGLAFVCRIQGRPSADESLHTDGNPDYHERCVDTPPQSAYWGYWYASNGGSWTYSNTGPKNRDAIKGGFEGWSFSLNHGAGNNPPPGVAPTTARHEPTVVTVHVRALVVLPGIDGRTGSSTSNGGPSAPGAGPGQSGPGGSTTSGSAADGPGGAQHSDGDGKNGENRSGSHDGRAEQEHSGTPDGSPTESASTTPSEDDETVRVTGELPADRVRGLLTRCCEFPTLWGVGFLGVLVGEQE